MKLTEHFKDFLDDTVNLNTSRLEQLESSVSAIKDFVRTSEWKPRVKYFTEQGSWAHKTIIKPVENNAFDADLLVMVEPVSGWDASAYLTSLRAIFADSGIYKDKVRRYSHCITIEYAGERKIDVAPCVVNRLGFTSEEVCNHDDNVFEPSAPEAYTGWLVERNAWTGGNALRKVTRLLKYLRDIKGTFTCPSFLLTALLGERITAADADNAIDFADVPTALRTIVGRLDEWLQLRPTRPSVRNPVLASEDLSGLWDNDQYVNFRNKVHQYREWIDDAYLEEKRDESIGKWRRVFGGEFAKGVALGKAARVTEAARQFVLASASGLAAYVREDLVGLFCRFGRQVLPPDFDDLPHKHRPLWRWAQGTTMSIDIRASLHRSKNGAKVRDVSSGEGPLPKEYWLHFSARASSVFQVGANHEIHWRITNTDEEASDDDCLRGGFEESEEDGTSRWERLGYRGVHMVEAFAVRRSDGRLLGQSAPFYVVVG